MVVASVRPNLEIRLPIQAGKLRKDNNMDECENGWLSWEVIEPNLKSASMMHDLLHEHSLRILQECLKSLFRA